MSARFKTPGIDVNASYARRIGGLGSFNQALVGTYTRTLTSSLCRTGVGGFDCVASSAPRDGTPTPKWGVKVPRRILTPSQRSRDLGQWRYFSSVRNDTLSEDPDLNGTGTPHSAPGNAKYDARSYFDLALTARLADRYNLRLGANNILDTEPPVSGQEVTPLPYGTGNTFPQVYDALGRYLFAGVTIDF